MAYLPSFRSSLFNTFILIFLSFVAHRNPLYVSMLVIIIPHSSVCQTFDHFFSIYRIFLFFWCFLSVFLTSFTTNLYILFIVMKILLCYTNAVVKSDVMVTGSHCPGCYIESSLFCLSEHSDTSFILCCRKPNLYIARVYTIYT